MFNLSPDLEKRFERYIALASGIFLLLLAVSGNFVAETLGCKTQYALTNNMFLKNLVILFMIYFTINYTSDEAEHPLVSMKNALIMWVLFVLFGRMRPSYTLAVIILLLISYMLNNFRKYYKSSAPEDKTESSLSDGKTNKTVEKKQQVATDKQLFELQTISVSTAIILIIFGSLMYLRDKKREYGRNFQVMKFIFGVKKCASLS